MDGYESVGDSQSEEELDQSISWNYIENEKNRSTRKARQLDKLLKELKPLNNAFKNIPTTKSRHYSFSKNNQFTVVAAEFLNLSSKEELDRLFLEGYSKIEIENMLENKYQEKKFFFTDLNIKQHKFKRKNFDSWRTMSNSHSLSTNTFISEEELVSQMKKPQQLRLKRINNKPLKKYETKINENNITKNTIQSTDISENKKSQFDENKFSNIHTKLKPTKLRLPNIPNESSLIRIPSTDDANNSSLLIINKTDTAQTLETNIHNEITIKSTEDRDSILESINKNPSSPIIEYQENTPEFIDNNVNDGNIVSDKTQRKIDDDISQFNLENNNETNITEKTHQLLPIQPSDKVTSDNEISRSNDELSVNSNVSSQTERNNTDSQIPDTQKELQEIFSDEKNTTGLSSDNAKMNQTVQLVSSPIRNYNNSNQPTNVFGRSLRHRTIVNRNPYLVDRAEYLGLSTKYELISLAEDGKSDDDIMRFLDGKYQKRRKERKDKDVGYGPFSKKSFYEIMSGKEKSKIDYEVNNADSITDSYQLNADDFISDQEFELSMNEDESNINEDLDDTNNIINSTNNKNTINITDSSKDYTAQTNIIDRKYKSSSSTEKFRDSPELDHMVQKKKRKRVTKDIYPIENVTEKSKRKKKSSKINEFHINNESIKSYHETTDFKPYSMDFLTLSDDENLDINTNDNKITDNKITIPPKVKGNSSSKNEIGHTSSIRKILGNTHISSRKEKDTNVSKGKNGTTAPRSHKGKETNKNVIGTFAPLANPNYVFNRTPNSGTYQEEIIGPNIIAEINPQKTLEFDVENAKNTGIHLKTNNKVSVSSNNNDKKDYLNKIQELWHKYSDLKMIDHHKYNFILNLKPLDYKTMKVPHAFLTSALFVKALSENETFYRNKNIILELTSTKITFYVPLKPESTLSQISAFHNVLLGALQTETLGKAEIKQLRKSLIHIIMILCNASNDCPEILPRIGLEMNSFLNRYKKLTEINQFIFCIFAPYFLIYMKLFQKFLPVNSEYVSSFRNTESWLCKKIVSNICAISFEKVFIYSKSIMIESIFIFLKCTSNPWSHVESLQYSNDIDFLNILNFLYFCNSQNSVEMDWEIFTTILNKLSDEKHKKEGDRFLIKNIFASILKINRELAWELEDQLVIRMFRLLAEYKFENIGTNTSSKATIYPNIPGTDSLCEDDGCLDIYFKILDIYTKQYLSENTKKLVERLIPVRSTLGYSAIQLQNRAKVLLMMVYTFDQDLLSSLESIINDMIRNGTLYSIKSALALIRTIVRQTPRRPYNIVRKYLPQLISKIHHLPPDREVIIAMKDLIYSVNELLNGQDISHLKRMIDFFGIILKFRYTDIDPSFEIILNKSFIIISQQYEFLQGVEVSDKDVNRLKKSLGEVISHAKSRLLDEKITNTNVNKSLIQYWLFSSMKCQLPAIQLLYTEWNYFGNEKWRNKYEVTFFSYLIQMFDVSNIREEILMIFFKHLPMIFTDLSTFLHFIIKKKILIMDKEFENISSQMFQFKRVTITIKCFTVLLKDKNEEMIYNVLKSFIVSLKDQMANHEAKNYIREIGLYLFTVLNDRFDIPEWDYLITKLKLETIEGSISKKIQFVETVDDSIIVLEKSYITSISSHSIDEFNKTFIEFIQYQIERDKTLDALCGIVSFHIEMIMKGNIKHWIHLSRWVYLLRYFLTFQMCGLNMCSITLVFCELRKLKENLISSYEYSYYFYMVLLELYILLDWSIDRFMGFDDLQKFIGNIWYFAGMDPLVTKDIDKNIKLPSLISISVDQKLFQLYQLNDHILNEAQKNQTQDRDIYLLQEEIGKNRVHIMEKCKKIITKDETVAQFGNN